MIIRLPQLAVSAKLLCLLMVVICGAVPSMVRSVSLYNECSCSHMRVDMKGRVLADDDNSTRFENLTIRSLDFSVKLTIFAEESRRYLCFNNRWKLVGLKKFRGAMCEFYEDMIQEGYNRFRSVANQSHFIGFNQKGKPLRGTVTRKKGFRKPKCFNFLKRDSDFSINDHNRKIAGGNLSVEVPASTHQLLIKNKQRNGSFNNKGNKQFGKNVPRRLRHKNHHRNSKKHS